VAGLFLLSTGGSTPAEGQLTLAPGDGLELISAVLWALHVILIGRLAGRTNGLRLALVQYLACGSLSTALGLAFELHTLGGLATAWWAVVYGGVLSVGVGYTLQVIGQKATPAADAAIILSMEAAFAALFGWLLLGETLTVRQLLGCGLMLAGMLLAQASALRRAEPHRPPHTNSSVVTTYKETT
jgi:drug/metabolite transporter (DMT)-like permease